MISSYRAGLGRNEHMGKKKRSLDYKKLGRTTWPLKRHLQFRASTGEFGVTACNKFLSVDRMTFDKARVDCELCRAYMKRVEANRITPLHR